MKDDVESNNETLFSLAAQLGLEYTAPDPEEMERLKRERAAEKPTSAIDKPFSQLT